MSRPFDYNGFAVSKSEPKKSLKIVKKTLLIDSADRDTRKYFTNGEFVVYLPRVYENVVSIRLAAAEFPPLVAVTPTVSSIVSAVATPANGTTTITVASTTGFNPGNSVLINVGSTGTATFNGVYTIITVPNTTTFTVATSLTGAITVSGTGPLATIQTPGARTHQFANGQTNVSSSTFTSDAVVPAGTYYFLLELEGLNKTDELAVASSKSSFPDGFFAKIPALSNTYNSGTFIEYNDHSAQENIARYSPAIGKIDRLHISTRLHNQKDNNIGLMYWTNDGNVASVASTNTGANYNLTLEIEMLENAFDDFSGMETHLRDRS